jgi:hypothetical protein
MQLERIWLGRWLVLIVLVISHVIVVLQSSGDASEVAGMITEIDVRSGNAEVRRVDVADWRPASPLLALDVGDVVRVNGDGYVVVLLAGGRGSLRIDATNSPVVIQGPRPTQSVGPLGGGLLGAFRPESGLTSTEAPRKPRAY